MNATFVGSNRGAIRSAYGEKVDITGQLTAPGGKPVAGAKLSVLMQDKMVGAKMIPAGEIVIDANSRFRYVTTAVRSRTIRFAYRTHLEDTAFAQTTDISLGVIAKVSLKTNKGSLRNGQTVRFSGTIAGAPVNASKAVELQVKKGKRWMTFRTTRLRRAVQRELPVHGYARPSHLHVPRPRAPGGRLPVPDRRLPRGPRSRCVASTTHIAHEPPADHLRSAASQPVRAGQLAVSSRHVSPTAASMRCVRRTAAGRRATRASDTGARHGSIAFAR
jgi:hypothetical protein